MTCHTRIAAPERLIALDIETVPDRERLPPDWGAKFPKPIHHRIACISYVEAGIERDGDGGERHAVTACRSGGAADWDERRLLSGFWAYFARRPTRVVGWNTRGFDLPVLLQRSLVHGLSAAPWFAATNRFEGYRHRYGEAWHCDLMDQLADYGACAKLGLDDAAAATGLPGKLGGHGSEVEAMVAAGGLAAVRAYCEADCLNLYGLYLRHGLLTGRIGRAGHAAAVGDLAAYLAAEGAGRPHLREFLDRWAEASPGVGVGLTTADAVAAPTAADAIEPSPASTVQHLPMLSAWRGRSGRCYAVAVQSLDTPDLVAERASVVVAVARDAEGRPAIVAVRPCEAGDAGFLGWLAACAQRGASELHAHRFAETAAERAAIADDLNGSTGPVSTPGGGRPR